MVITLIAANMTIERNVIEWLLWAFTARVTSGRELIPCCCESATVVCTAVEHYWCWSILGHCHSVLFILWGWAGAVTLLKGLEQTQDPDKAAPRFLSSLQKCATPALNVLGAVVIGGRRHGKGGGFVF